MAITLEGRQGKFEKEILKISKSIRKELDYARHEPELIKDRNERIKMLMDLLDKMKYYYFKFFQ